MAYIITAINQNKKIARTAYSDFQAFTIINQLRRDGCTDIGMREEVEENPPRSGNSKGTRCK